MKYIISYQSQSKKICFDELSKLNANFKEILTLNDNQSLVQINLPKQELASMVLHSPLIFVRHLIAVENELKKPINYDNLIDLFFKKLNTNKTFSIQFLTNINRENCEINVEELSNKIIMQGFQLNVKNPEQIISIFENKDTIFIGIGNTQTNLSSFKAGMPHFSKKDEFISRAEYKLLEAIDLCSIDLTKMKLGADLGSAPGGWTKVLSSHNIYVHSIDPASLAVEVRALSNVKHFRMTTQEYLQRYNYKNFDIVVNDMKMDIVLSTQIIMDFYDRIANNGYVVMTFKLAKNFSYANIIKCINKLKQKYNLILARQLFHNRSEITVVLQKSE